jgi:hypothetical protein
MTIGPNNKRKGPRLLHSEELVEQRQLLQHQLVQHPPVLLGHSGDPVLGEQPTFECLSDLFEYSFFFSLYNHGCC